MKFQPGDRVYWPAEKSRGVHEQHGTIVKSAFLDDRVVMIHFDGRAEPSELYFPTEILHAEPICPGLMVRAIDGSVFEVMTMEADLGNEPCAKVRRPCDGAFLFINLVNLRVIDGGRERKVKKDLPESFRSRGNGMKEEETVEANTPDYQVDDLVELKGGGTAPNRTGIVVEPPFADHTGVTRVTVRLDGDEEVSAIVATSLQRVPVVVGSYVRKCDIHGWALGVVEDAECVARALPGIHEAQRQEDQRIAAWQTKMDDVLRPAIAVATRAASASILDHVTVTHRDAVVIRELEEKGKAKDLAIIDLKDQVKRLLASELHANEMKARMEEALGRQQRLVEIAKKQLGERAWKVAEDMAKERS